MIDTVAIRNKLMHLAVSGNLVEHDIEDGNASELVEKISHEINGSSRREVAIDEIPYEIPENWTWCRLSDIGSTNIGLTYHPEDVVIDGIPVLRSNNIKYNKLIFDDLIKVNCEIREKQYIGENDILICARNGSKALVGKCAIYSGELGLTSFGAFMAVYRTQCFEYVYYYFQTKVFRRYFENENNKQINQVTQSILRDAIIPLPPIKEQKRIVEKINKVFELLDVIDEMQQQYSSDLEVLKSKIIDAGIQGKLTEQLPEDGTAEELLEQIEIQKNTILKNRNGRADKKIKDIDGDFPYEIPSHWKWIRFGNIGLFKKGPFGSALTKSMFVPKGENTVKVYEQQHAINKDNTLGTYYITREYFDDSMSGFEVLPGDIIVSCAGTIGETYIMPDDIEQGIINQALMRVTLAEGVNRKFFQYYFDANLKKSAQNESNGSAIKNIPPFDVMKNWYFPIPPLEEQERIVEKIENILTIL